jgi:hypothetical protein
MEGAPRGARGEGLGCRRRGSWPGKRAKAHVTGQRPSARRGSRPRTRCPRGRCRYWGLGGRVLPPLGGSGPAPHFGGSDGVRSRRALERREGLSLAPSPSQSRRSTPSVGEGRLQGPPRWSGGEQDLAARSLGVALVPQGGHPADRPRADGQSPAGLGQGMGEGKRDDGARDDRQVAPGLDRLSEEGVGHPSTRRAPAVADGRLVREELTSLAALPRARGPRPKDVPQPGPALHPRLPAPFVASPALRQPVEPVDLLDQPLASSMLQIEDLFPRPVKVIGHVRDFLEESVRRVRQDSPGGSPWSWPARSTANSCWHEGQRTRASVWPS